MRNAFASLLQIRSTHFARRRRVIFYLFLHNHAGFIYLLLLALNVCVGARARASRGYSTHTPLPSIEEIFLCALVTRHENIAPPQNRGDFGEVSLRSTSARKHVHPTVRVEPQPPGWVAEARPPPPSYLKHPAGCCENPHRACGLSVGHSSLVSSPPLPADIEAQQKGGISALWHLLHPKSA